MTHLSCGAAAFLFALSPAFAAPPLDEAEVRLPYAELRKLLDQAAVPAVREVPAATLLSVRLRLSHENNQAVLTASFKTTSFHDELAVIPLIGGGLTLESQLTPDQRVILKQNMLCHVVEQAGIHPLELRLLPPATGDAFEMIIPPCPTVFLEVADLGDDRSVMVKTSLAEFMVGADQSVPLPLTGEPVQIRLLEGEETREAQRTPEPSAWTWQHQALVRPHEGELHYQILARASAADGSGVSGSLRFPAEARHIIVEGADLVSARRTPNAEGLVRYQLEWRTRGVLERDLQVGYRMPLRPLDPRWTLHAPLGEEEGTTRSRFVVAASRSLNYAAEGLRGPFTPDNLPPALAATLEGALAYDIEAAERAEIAVTFMPTVATAEAVVTDATWTLKIEPDGAMLVQGVMQIAHRSPFGFVFDTPPGMELLSCEVADASVAPVDLGGGKLEVAMAGESANAKVTCSFTGRAPALDPVEGTLELALPQTPFFVAALAWSVELPREYQAEVHGNLGRIEPAGDAPPNHIKLKKNLIRDERPAVNVFYQRTGSHR